MSRYWNSLVAKLDPYVPGEQPRIQNLIKLNTNEHPYGPSPKVIEAIKAHANDSLRLYPDPSALELRQSIARRFGLALDQIFVGNGSDEVLGHVFHALLKHDRPLVFPDITYSFYPVYCGLYEIDFKTIPLDSELKIRVEDYLPGAAVGPVGGIIFPNPNAPTGAAHKLGEVERIIAANQDVVVVVDEAYVDFGAQSAVSLIDKYPNLLIVHTLSKSRSLAGLRVGYAMGHPDLIQGLDRVKNCFNSYPLDRLALAGATAAMEDQEYFEKTRDAVVHSREALTNGLEQLGFQVLPSAANFVFAKHPARDGAALAAALREKNIIVRHFKTPRIDQFLRITIGTDEQCAQLLDACRLILS
ncbi:histidinol-phosphate transaminase [Zwartia vadi]|uniref:histidinol-phosphate transaminase n=1 Tax=Zwartia vadi TaxID=3058168 RepID=UPI0025B48ABE|nr:histidinol-phosphate transaminase [Zwartia vadi]MDN3988427.1 histidinol-phosphate transaminase [Zwartia vadi]